jgi:hypothetical protein
MKVFLTCITVFLISISNGSSQENEKVKHIEKIKVGEEVKEVNVNYSFKNMEGKGTLLKVRFFNKTKVNLNVDVVMGFYSNGILLEKADLADCLKKSFFSNFFRPYHLIETSFEPKSDVEVEVLNFNSEQVNECRETHK